MDTTRNPDPIGRRYNLQDARHHEADAPHVELMEHRKQLFRLAAECYLLAGKRRDARQFRWLALLPRRGPRRCVADGAGICRRTVAGRIRPLLAGTAANRSGNGKGE